MDTNHTCTLDNRGAVEIDKEDWHANDSDCVMKHFFFNWTAEIAYRIILVIMIAVFAVASTSWIIVGPWRLANRLRGRLWLTN